MTLEDQRVLVPDTDAEQQARIDLHGAKWPPEVPSRVYLADSVTMTNPDRPILAVSPSHPWGSNFRMTAESMFVVEANRAIANQGFDDFADDAGSFEGGILHLSSDV